MSNPITLKRLKELGLTASETKAYLSLLKKEILTVTEVSKIAGIPRPNAYEALEKLLVKGFCISRPGNTKKYSALEPATMREKAAIIIDDAFERGIGDLDRKKDEILSKKKVAEENLGNLIDELTPLYENSRSNRNPLEYIEIIKDPFQMHKTFMQLIGAAKREVLVFSKPPYSGPRGRLEQQFKQQVKPLQRRLVIKGIYEIPKDEEDIEWRFGIIDRAAKHGEMARVIEELPMKMAIFDERVVILALVDPILGETSFTTQIIKHSDLAKGLKILFDTLWAQARDYHALEDYIEELHANIMKGGQ